MIQHKRLCKKCGGKLYGIIKDTDLITKGVCKKCYDAFNKMKTNIKPEVKEVKSQQTDNKEIKETIKETFVDGKEVFDDYYDKKKGKK